MVFGTTTSSKKSGRHGPSQASVTPIQRLCTAILLSASLVGCTVPAQQALRHRSYVPPDLRPKDVRRLIVLGDSIGAGSGASTPTLAYPWLLLKNDDAVWPRERYTSLTAKYGRPIEMVNVAARGATTSSVAQQAASLERILGARVEGHSIVAITIGGNDLYGRILSLGDPTPALLDAAIENLRDLVGYLHDVKRFPDGTSIYLMAVFDPSDGVGKAPQCFFGLDLAAFVPALDAWRDAYIRLGTELNFAVVDALGAFHGHGLHNGDVGSRYFYAPDPSPWFSPDCRHPNDRGHNEIRRLFFEAIDREYVATP